VLLKGLPSAAGSAAGLQSGLEKSGCAWAAAVDVAGLADALVEESRLEVVLGLPTGEEKGSGLLLSQWGLAAGGRPEQGLLEEILLDHRGECHGQVLRRRSGHGLLVVVRPMERGYMVID